MALCRAIETAARHPPVSLSEEEVAVVEGKLGDDVIARLNPVTGEIESVQVLFFSTRLLRQDLVELPITADLRLPVAA